MALQGLKASAAADLPQAHRLIMTATSKGLAIRTEGHRADGAGMTLQGVEACATADLPQAHHLIMAATGKSSPIRAEGQRVDPIDMSPKGLQWGNYSGPDNTL